MFNNIQKPNPQLGNVGNLGDILKHAALMNLVELAINHSRTRTAYIETHAFMLEATCPNPKQWLRETTAEFDKHPSYNAYFNTEKRLTDNKPYRCSAGLVIDMLMGAKVSDPQIILCEKDIATRDILRDQLIREKVTNYTLLEDALNLNSQNLPDDVDTILMLVDPFVLDAELWSGVISALNRFVRPGIEIILELFTYDNQLSAVSWPKAPAHLIGPIAAMHRQPYHLAVYTTSKLKDSAIQACLGLGWRPHA